MWGSLSTLECRRQVQRIMSVRQKAQTEGREGAAAALDVMLPMEVMTGVTPVESEPVGLPGDVLPWLFGLPFPFRGVGSSKVQPDVLSQVVLQKLLLARNAHVLFHGSGAGWR